jgi:hypothetical protein
VGEVRYEGDTREFINSTKDELRILDFRVQYSTQRPAILTETSVMFLGFSKKILE